jgi:hypothetical protein
MSTQRSPIMTRKTQAIMERTLEEVLTQVAAGKISPAAAKGGILYLIASIDNGEPNEIETSTKDLSIYSSASD